MSHDSNEHWIWTIGLQHWRHPKSLGIPLLDLTVKSGIEAFAPGWNFLMQYKRGEIGIGSYTEQYHAKVIPTLESHPHLWQRFLHTPNVALGCYCKAGEFCHRHLFSNLLIHYLQYHGKKVLFQGEMIPFTHQSEEHRQHHEQSLQTQENNANHHIDF